MRVELAGVPETLLWTLWHRAVEARRDDAVLDDPTANPRGTVVALGEGLETQFWRVDNGSVRWVTVDLPETIELRERLLPGSERQTAVARSAFDATWMDEIDPANGLLITAQGLFMYFEFAEVERLVAAMRRRFPGSVLMFDAVRGSLAKRSQKPREGGYQPPPWLWAIDAAKRRALDAESLRLPRGRGILRLLRLSPVEFLRTRL